MVAYLGSSGSSAQLAGAVPAVCQREFDERQRQDLAASSSMRPAQNCELVPIQEVAQAIDWLERNGIAGGG